MKDWSRIRKEYLKGNTTYEKLAKKYNVSYASLKDVGRREKWLQLRKMQNEKTIKKTIEKTSEKTSAEVANQKLQLSNYRLILLQEIGKALDEGQLYTTVCRNKMKYTKKAVDPETKQVIDVLFEEEIPKVVKINKLNINEVKALSSVFDSIQQTFDDDNNNNQHQINISITGASQEKDNEVI